MERLTLKRSVLFMLVVFSFVTLAGCKSMEGAFNRTKEALGAGKRDILVGEVHDARITLEEVRAQFQSSRDTFRSAFESREGKLDEKNSLLKSEHKRAAKKAADIEKDIHSVSAAAEELYAEWETELSYYTIINLRTASEQRLQEARGRSRQLLDSMVRVNEQSALILVAFNDLVLISRHNLSSGPIEAVNTELAAVNEKVGLLVQEIDASISEADALVLLLEGYEEVQQSSPSPAGADSQ